MNSIKNIKRMKKNGKQRCSRVFTTLGQLDEVQPRGNNCSTILNYINSWRFYIIFLIACRFCCLDMMLLQDPAPLSWSSLWLGCRADVWTDQIRRGRGGGLEEATQPCGGDQDVPAESSPCKIAFSVILNCLFLQDEFSKRLSLSLPVLVCDCIILPKLFQLKCSPCGCGEGCQCTGSARGGKSEKKWKKIKNIRKTLHVVNHLQDSRWTNTMEWQPLKLN